MPHSLATKRLMAQAIKQCMKEQTFAKIRIKDITDKCGFNRNSFYYHFKDKYDLIAWTFESEFSDVLNAENYESPWEELYRVSLYFYDNQNFYACALQELGQNSLKEHFRELMRHSLKKHAEHIFPASEHREFFTVFYADALTECTLRWLTGSVRYSPEEITALVHSAITGAAVLDEYDFPPR